MKLDEIRLGDVVRLRNGELLTVGSKTTSYSDSSGRHEGPFVGDRGFRSRFLLADIADVVIANPRRCSLCGEGVTARSPDVDYCEGCFYSGRAWEATMSALLARLRAVEGVREASVWHTGGGCFLLAVAFVDGRLATCDDSNSGLPRDKSERWRLVVVSESVEAFEEYDEDRIAIHEGEWTDETLFAFLRETAS